MRALPIILVALHLLPTPALAAKSKANSSSGLQGTALAICTTALQRNLVQIRGDGDQIRITVNKSKGLVGTIVANRKVKGTARAKNLEIEYQGANGFVSISCNSEPAGLIQVNGTTDYLTCNSGPDARAIQLCNRAWNSRR